MDNRKPPNFSRRGSSLSFREPKHTDNTTQYCNRIGCSTRLNSTKAVQIQTLAKTKITKTSLGSLNTNYVGESSNNQTKAYRPRSNHKSEQEDPDLESPTSQSSSNSRPHKQITRRFVSTNHETPSSSSASPRNSSIKPTSQVPKSSLQNSGPRQPRFGLKNLNCSSVPDILPSNRRVASVRKNTSAAENTSSRGKSLGIQSTDSSSSSISQQATRRLRSNKPVIRERPGPGLGPTSVRTRSNQVGASRIRLSGRQDDDVVRVDNTQLMIPEVFPENSSVSLPVDSDVSITSSTSGGQGFLSRLVNNRSEGSSSHGAIGDRDGYRRLNVEGIAEVLMALERIEQENELTYEQLMMIETNLFLGGFSFHDRHRDMRMDIDNMSYEELLALEEKMGNVSTALSEEALMKCIKRSTYMPASQLDDAASNGEDEIKCSMCQEEYFAGDDLGKLACSHFYHTNCISQWLRQKNWCPICKTSAVASTSNAEEKKD